MPPDDGVRMHDDQGCCANPATRWRAKQSIAVAGFGTLHGGREHGQLLTKCEILERDGSVSTADQHESSKRDDERSQHV